MNYIIYIYNMNNYYIKYIKYKNKYIKLKESTVTKTSDTIINNTIKEPIDLHYTKYMKYKTKYNETKGLVGGVEPCPKIFGFLGFTNKPIEHYLTNYDCTYNILKDKINNKLENFNYKEFKRINKETENSKVPITVAYLRHRGFPVKFLWNKGFPMRLLKEQYTLNEFKEGNFPLITLYKYGNFDIKTLYEEFGFQVINFKNNKFTVKQLKESIDIDAKTLLNGLYSVEELKEEGFDAKAFKSAGFRVQDLYLKRFSIKEIVEAGFTTSELRSLFDMKSLIDAGIDAKRLFDEGYTLLELRKLGFTLKKLLEAGFTLEELIPVGFTFQEFKEAGFDESELKKTGIAIESYLWYNDSKDQKFSLNNIYKDSVQEKINRVYSKFLKAKTNIDEENVNIKYYDYGLKYNITYHRTKLLKINFINEHFNIGIQLFRLPNCMLFIENYIYNYFNFSKIDLLSVGSGNGLFEKCCQDIFGVEIICIDPIPLSYRSKGLTVPYITSQYNTISEYVSSTNTKKDESFLLLIWTDPSLNYDVEAIIALNPLAFFIIYGKFPSAGSQNISSKLENESFTLGDQEYRQISVTTGIGFYVNQEIDIKMSLCINITKAKKYTSNEFSDSSYYKSQLYYKLKNNEDYQMENYVNIPKNSLFKL
jgi:hypothetical protein